MNIIFLSKNSKYELLEKILNYYIYEAPVNIYIEIYFINIWNDDFCAIKGIMV